MTAKDYIQEQYYWFQTYPYWFKTYSYWLIGSATPPAIVSSSLRSVIVKAEDREMEVADERKRIFIVPLEDRTNDVG